MLLQKIPNFKLQDLQGNKVSLHQFSGKKTLIFMWSSWWRCREQLPGWQDFYQKHKEENFEIISISVDLQGGDVVKPYIKETTFITLVDTENQLSNHFDFKIVPNGIFLDEEGSIRLIKQGFRVTEETHLQAVESLLRGEVETIELQDTYYKPNELNSDLEKQLSKTKFKLGMEYIKQGRKEEALRELDEALLLDSNNILIRKQRWYISYPEKFSPTIDIEWQQQQLEKERAEEAALKQGLACGLEGCVIPGTDFKPTIK